MTYAANRAKQATGLRHTGLWPALRVFFRPQTGHPVFLAAAVVVVVVEVVLVDFMMASRFRFGRFPARRVVATEVQYGKCHPEFQMDT
jgi:predicted signal transduction protein with EAL and GGDEF domain